MCSSDLDIRGINTCPDTCGSGSGSGGSFEVTLTNPFKLAGKAGDKFLAIKDLCAGLNSQCVIFQVQHDSYELVEHPFIHVGSRTCEGMVGAGNRTPGVDPDSQDGQCNIDYKWRAFSVMTCYTNSTQEHLIESVFTQVLTDWWVDGLCIKGKFNWIWALCGCTPQETILAGGTDCAYGSSCVE